ncbi:MAG: hypothetical protein HQL71_12665 [Magnetococcales bacterium]|nr:hypothetical protein [Magnetococcales bacterium]
MKNYKRVFSVLALAATITFGAVTTQADPRQAAWGGQQERMIIYTQTTPYAHPVDYWWHLDPSATGSWDYFSPVKHVAQPIPLARGTVSTLGTPAPSVRNRFKQSRNVVYLNPVAQ